jgi:HAD superfamily hydrolase (TIGR01458 family)
MSGLPIHGVLFDLDGVLYVGSQPIPGAAEAISAIRDSGLPCRFITNTSTQSLASLTAKIQGMGFAIPAEEIISAPQATLRYLQRLDDPVCRFLLAEDVRQDFAGFRQSDTDAEVIVIGDIGDAWSYRLLNEVFNCLMQGAKLIAIHKNRFWQTEQGLQMDIGGFIQALEYASGATTTIIGKPSADFFRIALDDMHVQAENAAIVGDDIDTDVGGGQEAGLMGILVRTGKYRQAYAEASVVKPVLVIDSVSSLPGVLGL